eukprot:COSAG01_NODE_771_length_13718_cov_54.441442_5_plen_351_part_00
MHARTHARIARHGGPAIDAAARPPPGPPRRSAPPRRVRAMRCELRCARARARARCGHGHRRAPPRRSYGCLMAAAAGPRMMMSLLITAAAAAAAAADAAGWSDAAAANLCPNSWVCDGAPEAHPFDSLGFHRWRVKLPPPVVPAASLDDDGAAADDGVRVTIPWRRRSTPPLSSPVAVRDTSGRPLSFTELNRTVGTLELVISRRVGLPWPAQQAEAAEALVYILPFTFIVDPYLYKDGMKAVKYAAKSYVCVRSASLYLVSEEWTGITSRAFAWMYVYIGMLYSSCGVCAGNLPQAKQFARPATASQSRQYQSMKGATTSLHSPAWSSLPPRKRQRQYWPRTLRRLRGW